MQKMIEGFSFSKANETAKSAELYFYGDISQASWLEKGNVDPKEVAATLSELKGKDLTIHIHSYGGDTFAGYTLYTLLKQHQGSITTVIDGMAASAASIIALAGETIKMSEAGMLMIHNSWGMAIGDANKLRERANQLERSTSIAVGIYAKKSGKTEEEIKKLLDAETYMTAREAKDNGFIDEIICLDSNMSLQINEDTLNWGGIDVTKFRSKLPPELLFREQKPLPQPETLIKTEGSNMDLTLEKLQADYPEIYQQAISEAIIAERERMQAIDEIAEPGCAALLKQAKYEAGLSVGEFALALAKHNKDKLSTIHAQREQEIVESGVNGVMALGIDSSASGTKFDQKPKDEKELQVFSSVIPFL